MEHILTHEETHYRHGDHIWAILRSLCLAVHWYNPLVWWAAVLSRRDCELSCDPGAILDIPYDYLYVTVNETSFAVETRTNELHRRADIIGSPYTGVLLAHYYDCQLLAKG